MSIEIDFLMPYAAEIHLTYRCDLACRTCNRACFVKPRIIEDLTIEAFEEFLEDTLLSGMPVKYLILLGGEPTLHRDLQRFIALSSAYVKRLAGEVEIWSNGFSRRARNILDGIQACGDASCRVVTETQKPGGSVDFPMNTMYVSPLDLGIPRRSPCGWHTCHPHVERGAKRVTCGISVDSRGYTVCPLGGAITRVIAPHAIARRVKDLVDRDYVAWQTNELCRHCGVGMLFPAAVLDKVPRVAGTLMTRTWSDGFRRLENEGLRLVDGLACKPEKEQEECPDGG